MIFYKTIYFTRAGYSSFISLSDKDSNTLIDFLQQFNPLIYSTEECMSSLEFEIAEGAIFKEFDQIILQQNGLFISFDIKKVLTIYSIYRIEYLKKYIYQLENLNSNTTRVRPEQGERAEKEPVSESKKNKSKSNKFIDRLRKNLGL